MCSESYLNYDKRVNLFSRKIGKDRIDFIKKDGIVTLYAFVREIRIYTSLSEKYEQPYWFPIFKITSGCNFYSSSYQSKCQKEEKFMITIAMLQKLRNSFAKFQVDL